MKMLNKRIMKMVFDEEWNHKKMKQQIIFKYTRNEKRKMYKIVKYAIVPICLVFAIFLGTIFNNRNDILENNNMSVMKVYAYTLLENERLEKKELKDNVKLELAHYNSLMSSVPGYPILFELDHVDHITIEVRNGHILDWNKDTGEVKNLGTTYQLSENGSLYFQINENTNIRIIGIKNDDELFEKNITISSDDDLNYYAILR